MQREIFKKTTKKYKLEIDIFTGFGILLMRQGPIIHLILGPFVFGYTKYRDHKKNVLKRS